MTSTSKPNEHHNRIAEVLVFDYRIELHSPVTTYACLFEDIAAKSPAYALAPPCRVDNESRIGDVRTRARVVWMSVRAADNTSIVIDGDNGAPW